MNLVNLQNDLPNGWIYYNWYRFIFQFNRPSINFSLDKNKKSFIRLISAHLSNFKIIYTESFKIAELASGLYPARVSFYSSLVNTDISTSIILPFGCKFSEKYFDVLDEMRMDLSEIEETDAQFFRDNYKEILQKVTGTFVKNLNDIRITKIFYL